MINFGSGASARAIAIRWRWPPENSCGYFRITFASKPTVAISASMRSSSASPLSPGCRCRTASASVVNTVIRGFNEAYGSWNTIWKSNRRRRISPAERSASTSPSSTIRPDVGGSNCITVRESVDFPQPDSPTNPRISPFSNSSETPSTARIVVRFGANHVPLRCVK